MLYALSNSFTRLKSLSRHFYNTPQLRTQECGLVWHATRAYLKMKVFWHVAPSGLMEGARRFRQAYCFHHGKDDEELMMEAANAYETSYNFYHTTR
jgi:hypothetical protein